VTQRNLMILAFLFLVAFLGILLWRVPRFDLGGVIAFTLLLAGYDIFSTNNFSGKK
jgi:hypothetical protein